MRLSSQAPGLALGGWSRRLVMCLFLFIICYLRKSASCAVGVWHSSNWLGSQLDDRELARWWSNQSSRDVAEGFSKEAQRVNASRLELQRVTAGQNERSVGTAIWACRGCRHEGEPLAWLRDNPAEPENACTTHCWGSANCRNGLFWLPTVRRIYLDSGARRIFYRVGSARYHPYRALVGKQYSLGPAECRLCHVYTRWRRVYSTFSTSKSYTCIRPPPHWLQNRKAASHFLQRLQPPKKGQSAPRPPKHSLALSHPIARLPKTLPRVSQESRPNSSKCLIQYDPYNLRSSTRGAPI
jgi:hypothetical protein